MHDVYTSLNGYNLKLIDNGDGTYSLNVGDIHNSFPITLSDTEDLEHPTRRIYIGTDGDLTVVRTGGQTVTYRNLCAGFHYIPATRVKATGTTALNIIGEW